MRFTALLVIIALGLFFAWSDDAARWGNLFDIAARSAMVAVASFAVLRLFLRAPRRASLQLALIALIAFELISVNINQPANYDSIPYGEQTPMAPPPLIQTVLDDVDSRPFRVDGFRGLRDNYGSLYGLMDMRGISPLFLKGPQAIIHRDYVNNPLAWELFAVKYIFSGSGTLSLPSVVIDRGHDRDGEVYLHRLEDPRPFAILYYEADIVDSDEWALQLMADPRFNEREKIVLHQPPTLKLPAAAAAGSVQIKSFAPEAITLDIDTAENAILSISLPHYPGWQARLNGKATEIVRAYAGLSAIEIPAGQHVLSLEFAPLTYTIGASISLAAWLALALLALATVWRR